MNKILTILGMLLWSSLLSAQSISPVIDVSNDSKILEELSAEYKSSLFVASDADFVKTMENWKHTLTAIENYAEEIDFNLKGVKLWLKVFWAKDGQIDHITYYLSETSINIDRIDLEAFLRSFMRKYKLPQSYKQRFSYDARVTFPLYLMR